MLVPPPALSTSYSSEPPANRNDYLPAYEIDAPRRQEEKCRTVFFIAGAVLLTFWMLLWEWLFGKGFGSKSSGGGSEGGDVLVTITIPERG